MSSVITYGEIFTVFGVAFYVYVHNTPDGEYIAKLARRGSPEVVAEFRSGCETSAVEMAKEGAKQYASKMLGGENKAMEEKIRSLEKRISALEDALNQK